MATFSMIGIILMVCAGILLAYQVLAAFLGMGTSDDFVFENISLGDILGESSLEWIDGISLSAIHDLLATLISMPLVVLLLGGAILFFLIHIFKGHK